MITIFSFAPIVLLIWLMVKKDGMPSNKALPLVALITYFMALIIFNHDPLMVHANVLQGLLIAWTPILIIAGAILLFKTMELTGSIQIIKSWLNMVTENQIAQLMIVGWAFPFLIEGASGFGTPAAIAAPILVGLGYPPMRVAILSLMMNTVPVSFGAVGTPTWFGFSAISLTESEMLEIGFQSATIHTLIAIFIVVIALRQLNDLNAIKKNFVFILLSVAVTVIPYWLIAYIDYEFPALIGGATGLLFSVILARAGVGLEKSSQPTASTSSASIATLIKAFFPLWGTILLLVITRIPQLGILPLLTGSDPWVQVPLGSLGEFSMSKSLVVGINDILKSDVRWSHRLLYIPSIIPFGVISLITFWLYNSSRKTIKESFSITISQMVKPTVALLGALVFVNLMMLGDSSSAVSTIGSTLAQIAGDHWTFFSPFLGAVGSFFSGSATISNLTFGAVQESIAAEVGLNRTTILALQSVGGSFGNMVCINNIVAVTSVLSLTKVEGNILKKTFLPALLYGLLAGIIAWLLFNP